MRLSEHHKTLATAVAVAAVAYRAPKRGVSWRGVTAGVDILIVNTASVGNVPNGLLNLIGAWPRLHLSIVVHVTVSLSISLSLFVSAVNRELR